MAKERDRRARGRWPWLRRCGYAAAGFLLLFSFTMAYGITGEDARRLVVFGQAVDRWQVNPNFRPPRSGGGAGGGAAVRSTGYEYATLGYEGMRARFWGLTTTQVVMTLRSIPGLPKELAVNPTSQKHYDNFERGPLSAYLHLCSEGNTHDIVPLLEIFARERGEAISEEDLRAFLKQNFQLDHPVALDEGARASLRRLIADTQPREPFVYRTNVQDLLRPHIAAIAARQGWPTEPEKMTPEQQLFVLDRLDDEVEGADRQLWRTKQVNDFTGGIWAQVYGPMYHIMMGPFLWARSICRVTTPLMGVALGAFVFVRRMRPGAPVEEARLEAVAA